MKTKFLALVLGAFLAIPCVLRAEETEIPLMAVVEISFGGSICYSSISGRPSVVKTIYSKTLIQ